jgi:hypothetical protein
VPISYSRDDTQRRIVAIGEGTFCAEDVLGILERMRADGTWTYGALYDLRRMSGSVPLSDLGRLMAGASQRGPNGESVGPTAVLVTDPVLYARACAYKALSPPQRFDVFSNRAEAEAWLAAQTMRANP